MSLSFWHRRLRRRLLGAHISVVYHPDYRFPRHLSALGVPIEPRAAERLLRFLQYEGFVREGEWTVPEQVSYADLARVHARRCIEMLLRPSAVQSAARSGGSPETGAHLLRTWRLIAGGTLASARRVLAHGGTAVNLAGGFVDVGYSGASGEDGVNDVALTVAALRAEGFAGQIAVVASSSTSFHNLRSCLQEEARGVACFGGEPHARGEDSELPLDASAASVALRFVVGAAMAAREPGRIQRPIAFHRRSPPSPAMGRKGTPTVWLPGPMVAPDGWRRAASALLETMGDATSIVSRDHPSWRRHFESVANLMLPEVLGGSVEVPVSGIASPAGVTAATRRRFLGYYTEEGIEYALFRYGVLPQIQRLGYGDFRVEIGTQVEGDRVRLYGRLGGSEYLVAECVAARHSIQRRSVLYVHWLELRDPVAACDGGPPALPGQDVPGLGVSAEVAQALAGAAHRLGLQGVALTPAWYHSAYLAKEQMRFLDARRQRRFESLCSLLQPFPLAVASRKVHSGAVLIAGSPYRWEADVMVGWFDEATPPSGDAVPEDYEPRFSLAIET